MFFLVYPKSSYLSQDRPNWRDKLGLYNPTTILWRYFAIADRRIRAKHWRATDMSASNPYFWTRRGWDGSEALSRKGQAYCASLPDRKHTALISWSTLKTLIVTLQGADSLYFLLTSYISPSDANFAMTASIGSLFSPLAILGLLRLVACSWLTEDFVYVNCEELQTTVARLNAPEQIQLVAVHKLPTNELLNNLDGWTGEDYRSPNSLRSWLFRTLFLFSIIGLLAMCLMNITPMPISEGTWYTATTFVITISYLFFLVISAIVYGYYFIRSRNTTTVLPCVASLWYQIYTGVLLALMLVLIVIASVETRKSPCGLYTTWPGDWDPCGEPLLSEIPCMSRGGDVAKIVTLNVEKRIAIDMCYASGTFPVLPDALPPPVAGIPAQAPPILASRATLKEIRLRPAKN
ncbi:hypothetical protein G7Y89_g8429 [Cudoniella acicularis]|uniref:Uncharacterized protein n=1 Tax=Cudoniella acicularis TaxID=354080 RepID=A0A8H4RI61_9HELO|nr:hypothetical protein G7Y89_g8429 [Cudoniella acicularis]